MQEKDSFKFLQALSKKVKTGREKIKDNEGAAFLGVKLHNEEYYIPVGQIRELVPNPQITAIGHAKAWLSGILKVQGEIYSVIDVATFLGQPPVTNKKSIAIALSVPEGYYAILVSSVTGVRRFDSLLPMNADDYTVTFKTSEQELLPALSIPSIIESKALTNMSIF